MEAFLEMSLSQYNKGKWSDNLSNSTFLKSQRVIS